MSEADAQIEALAKEIESQRGNILGSLGLSVLFDVGVNTADYQKVAP